ncbi:MAG: type II toxin-antitoxin system PemK/MazF family toxin [bacterium]
MVRFVKGDGVTLPFPFSDLSTVKRRPALVISDPLGEDVILCQITASRSDIYSVELKRIDFAIGSLTQDPSYARPNKLFTAESRIIEKKIGTIIPGKYREVVEIIVTIIS